MSKVREGMYHVININMDHINTKVISKSQF